jgi:hypothetical protein
MTSGLDIAQAAEHILQGHAGTLAEATAQLDHLNGTRDEWRQAVAFLACQVWAYRSRSDEDSSLALSQIGTIVREYNRRRADRGGAAADET